MQSKSRTCIDCSVFPLVVMSNSGHHFTVDIIITLLFRDTLSCFKGGSSSMQVTNNKLKSELFGNVFSNLTIRPLHLFPCLFLVARKSLLQPPPMDPFHLTFHSIVTNYRERILHFFLSTCDPHQLMQFHLHFAQPAAMALKMGVAVGSSHPVCLQVGVRWWCKFLCILGLTSNIQTTEYGFVTIPLHCTMVSTIDAPFCFSSKILNSNVIVNTGASVCISPHRSDFIA